MLLFRYEKRIIGKEAEESGFIRDTLEKVYRLVDILEYINQNSLLKNTLALKGGTAINLLVFNLPRLSIDIDLDYCKEVSRDEMLQEREVINKEVNIEFDLSNIDKITEYKIRTDLKPVLRRKERFDLDLAKKNVKEFIKELLTLSSEEKEFIQAFKQKDYCPELLFSNKEIIDRILKHPMAIWKTMNRGERG
jgi:hypothetical protein